MASTVNLILNAYIFEFGRIFSQANKVYILMLFSFVLLAIVFKFIVRRAR